MIFIFICRFCLYLHHALFNILLNIYFHFCKHKIVQNKIIIIIAITIIIITIAILIIIKRIIIIIIIIEIVKIKINTYNYI